MDLPLLRAVGFNRSLHADYAHVSDYRALQKSVPDGWIALDFHCTTGEVAESLAKPAWITIIDAHGGWIEGKPAIGGGGRWLPMDSVTTIGAQGVIFGACWSAHRDFLTDHVRGLLSGKGYLGGAGLIQNDDTRVLAARLVDLYSAGVSNRTAHAQDLIDKAFAAAVGSHGKRAWTARWARMSD
ncbi:hypothetical protein [Nocardia tengchongensis]|uniref:hypothetical protein n=1 Tax=Nocardia tengchongensis TaxID=2055889 RepID=UPI0036B27411